MSKRYPQEFHDFMKQYIPGHTTVEISEEAKRRLGIEISPAAVQSYIKNHKIRSGTLSGLPNGRASKQFPQHVKDYISENYKGVGPKEMAERLNQRFGTDYTVKQISAYYKNHGHSSGLTGHFQPGHVPANKGTHPPTRGRMGETQFRAGHTPHNKLPIGSIIMKTDGYMWQKLGEGARDWRQKHLLVWEEAHVPIPDGHVITFKDGDKTNYDLDNLALITMAESIELTRRGLRTENKELTETGILIARLNCKVSKKLKREIKMATNKKTEEAKKAAQSAQNDAQSVETTSVKF